MACCNNGFILDGERGIGGMKTRLSTSELARAAGVGIETIRYYERRGLIPQPDRNRSGYRLHVSAVVSTYEGSSRWCSAHRSISLRGFWYLRCASKCAS